MTDYASAAESLTKALHLSWPPIALCLADSVPDGGGQRLAPSMLCAVPSTSLLSRTNPLKVVRLRIAVGGFQEEMLEASMQ